MARKSERVIELEEAILNACEIIDNTDQSRAGLSEGMDNVRESLADAYGEDFEEDLAQKIGEELEVEDDDDQEDE